MQGRRSGSIILLVSLVVVQFQPQMASCPAVKPVPARDSHSYTTKTPSAEIQLTPEMQKLKNAFAGTWKVTEIFEISASKQEKSRQGNASFRVGPGACLIEDYQSNGSAGALNFLALLWWDQSARVYRLLTCANNDGCRLRGTAKWEGGHLVNSWREQVDGKTATFKDSFLDISPSSFRLISEGSSEGKEIWRVITRYERVLPSNQ